MKKPGRPKGTNRAEENKAISIWLPIPLYKKATEVAKADGRKVSAYIRQMLSEHLNKE